ncbi:MAG: hypothetical protein KF685_06850 [Acidobacteria bacterium]|nr:hypothetical protein [Acidobacteriota bacterium]
MQAVETERSAPFGETIHTGEALVTSLLKPAREPIEVIFDLWAWSSGLRSFLIAYDRSIGESDKPSAVTRNRTPEFQLTNAALTRLAGLLAELDRIPPSDISAIVDLSEKDRNDLISFVHDMSALNGSLAASPKLGFAEWKAWKDRLADTITRLGAFEKLEDASSAIAARFLPESFHDETLLDRLKAEDRDNLQTVSDRLSCILRILRLISRMLRNDEPLKPSLLLFCGVYEQIRSLIDHLNRTLSRSKNEEDMMFGLMDGAAYMASLELRKAYDQELTGIIAIHSAPAVFARVESAYALLNDSFQEILASFAKLLQPAIGTADLFPEFQHKLAESLLLRSHLSDALNAVQAAEKDPSDDQIKELKDLLRSFQEEPVEFLFYKDRESFERFCEEVYGTGETKDLVPILHRFTAYLETLLRQVNMRAVLSNHPFEVQR